MKKIKLIPYIGTRIANYMSESNIMDASVQGYISGSGNYCKGQAFRINKKCKGFCELAFTVSITLGNGAQGGGHKGFFDFGIWGDGSGVLNFCEGTITVSGGINASLSANAWNFAYNREFNSGRVYLIGPDGWLSEGGSYEELKWV